MSNGFVVSFTVTVNEAVPIFPAVSCVLQDTVVLPRANCEPDGGLHDTIGVLPSTRSVADTVYVTVAPDAPVASFVIDDGTVTVGGVVSWTVPVNEAVPIFPAASRALQITVVNPIGNCEPDRSEERSV